MIGINKATLINRPVKQQDKMRNLAAMPSTVDHSVMMSRKSSSESLTSKMLNRKSSKSSSESLKGKPLNSSKSPSESLIKAKTLSRRSSLESLKAKTTLNKKASSSSSESLKVSTTSSSTRSSSCSEISSLEATRAITPPRTFKGPMKRIKKKVPESSTAIIVPENGSSGAEEQSMAAKYISSLTPFSAVYREDTLQNLHAPANKNIMRAAAPPPITKRSDKLIVPPRARIMSKPACTTDPAVPRAGKTMDALPSQKREPTTARTLMMATTTANKIDSDIKPTTSPPLASSSQQSCTAPQPLKAQQTPRAVWPYRASTTPATTPSVTPPAPPPSQHSCVQPTSKKCTTVPPSQETQQPQQRRASIPNVEAGETLTLAIPLDGHSQTPTVRRNSQPSASVGLANEPISASTTGDKTRKRRSLGGPCTNIDDDDEVTTTTSVSSSSESTNPRQQRRSLSGPCTSLDEGELLFPKKTKKARDGLSVSWHTPRTPFVTDDSDCDHSPLVPTRQRSLRRTENTFDDDDDDDDGDGDSSSSRGGKRDPNGLSASCHDCPQTVPMTTTKHQEKPQPRTVPSAVPQPMPSNMSCDGTTAPAKELPAKTRQKKKANKATDTLSASCHTPQAAPKDMAHEHPVVPKKRPSVTTKNKTVSKATNAKNQTQNTASSVHVPQRRRMSMPSNMSIPVPAQEVPTQALSNKKKAKKTPDALSASCHGVTKTKKSSDETRTAKSASCHGPRTILLPITVEQQAPATPTFSPNRRMSIGKTNVFADSTQKEDKSAAAVSTFQTPIARKKKVKKDADRLSALTSPRTPNTTKTTNEIQNGTSPAKEQQSSKTITNTPIRRESKHNLSASCHGPRMVPPITVEKQQPPVTPTFVPHRRMSIGKTNAFVKSTQEEDKSTATVSPSHTPSIAKKKKVKKDVNSLSASSSPRTPNTMKTTNQIPRTSSAIFVPHKRMEFKKKTSSVPEGLNRLGDTSQKAPSKKAKKSTQTPTFVPHQRMSIKKKSSKTNRI